MTTLPAIAVTYLHRADTIAAQIGAIKISLVDALQRLIHQQRQLDNVLRLESMRRMRGVQAGGAVGRGHGVPIEGHQAPDTPSRAVASVEAALRDGRTHMQSLLQQLVAGAAALKDLHEALIVEFFDISTGLRPSVRPPTDSDHGAFARAQATVKNRVLEAEREAQVKGLQWTQCPPAQWPNLLQTWQQNLPDVRDRQMEDLARMMLS